MGDRLPYEDFDFRQLKRLVKACILPRKEIAARAGVTTVMMSKILSGQQAPGFDFISRVTRAIHVPMDSADRERPIVGKWRKLDENDPGMHAELLAELIWGKCLISCCRSMDSFLVHDEHALAIQKRELEERDLDPDVSDRYLELCLSSYPLRRDLRQKKEHGQLIISSDAVFREAATNGQWTDWTLRELKTHQLRCVPGLIEEPQWHILMQRIRGLPVKNWQKINVIDERLAALWSYSEIYVLDRPRDVERLRNDLLAAVEELKIGEIPDPRDFDGRKQRMKTIYRESTEPIVRGLLGMSHC